jgi:hypothetical protein
MFPKKARIQLNHECGEDWLWSVPGWEVDGQVEHRSMMPVDV